jgi:hypothetical protein
VNRFAFTLFLLVLSAAAAAQDVQYSIEISPASPTTATDVRITINGWCFSDPVRNGNVFTVTQGEACAGPPIQTSETFNVGRLEAGEYTVRIIEASDPGGFPLATTAFAVTAAAPAVPTLRGYAAMLFALALAAFAVRRIS